MNIYRITMPLLIAAAFLVAGCEEEEYQLKFSHHIHVTENEMDCSDCHGEPGESSFYTLTHDTCIDCHDEVEAEEVHMDTCGYCHEKKLLPQLEDWTPEARSVRNIFVHTIAMADQCGECHGAILDEHLDVVPRLRREDILQIREDAHSTEQDCIACHVDMDRYQEPASHDLAWLQRHGQLGIQTDAACSVCHSEDSCRECHSVMQPVSHNNLWRLRTHGVEAAWDRASCMVCHEEDSCTSCHSQVAPRSHGPLWAERHGTWEPGRCMVCHEPDTCNACHAENSPKSHMFNWDDNHCTQCHVTDGESCVVCHEGGNNKAALHENEWPSWHDGFNNQTDCLPCH